MSAGNARLDLRDPSAPTSAWRDDFPILARTVRGRPLVYLDNAATTQKPRAMVDAVTGFYLESNANVHRGVHALSEEATRAFEGARDILQRFVGAAHREEIILTGGTTDGVNLVAQTYGRTRVGPGDEILVTELEHHSNIVPWQMLAKERGARLRVLPIDDRGVLRLDLLPGLLSSRTRIVAVNHISNALGTVNPVAQLAASAHEVGAVILVDGAQALPHVPVDVQALDVDFYVASAHKVYGPTGVGLLYGRRHLLEAMPPWRGGGDMITRVTFEESRYNGLPQKFEAGTPNIAGVIGFGAAVAYLESLGWSAVSAHEHDLLRYGTERLAEVPGLRLIGTAPEKAGVLSFVLDAVHPHDVGTILDRSGIAVRAGHHCAQPVMDHFGVAATVRASLALYNRREDLDALVAGLHRVRDLFA